MVRSQAFRTGMTCIAVLALVGGLALAQHLRSDSPLAGLARGPKVTQANDNPEAAEQGEGTQERAEAFEAAVEAGTAGSAAIIRNAAPTGWAGEQPISATADDWEPAVATDPATGPNGVSYAYLLTTRYGDTKPCAGNCPTPYIALYTSTNAGATWTLRGPLCACKGSGQYDPIIEVVPGTGAVYALYLNGFNVMFTKSVNHGLTWSAPVKTYGTVSWTDKPILVVGANGTDVYVSFNGPTGGDPYLAQSHDGGATWTQRKMIDSNRYIYAFDGGIDANGTVYFAETSLLYGGGGNKDSYPTGTIDEHVFVITNKGGTITDHVVASVQPGITCVAAGCKPDYYLGHAALAVWGNGQGVLLYDGATTTGGNQLIYAASTTNGWASPSSPIALTSASEEALEPAARATSGTDIRAFYSQTSGGGNVDAWNTWYITSANGGASWSTPVKISDAANGAAYKTAAGYAEVYGDYGELGITSTGKTIAAWGEGTSYTGPGGVWVNVQP